MKHFATFLLLFVAAVIMYGAGAIFLESLNTGGALPLFVGFIGLVCFLGLADIIKLHFECYY